MMRGYILVSKLASPPRVHLCRHSHRFSSPYSTSYNGTSSQPLSSVLRPSAPTVPLIRRSSSLLESVADKSPATNASDDYHCDLLPKTAFVSGHIEHPDGYFDVHYAPPLDEAIKSGHSFVLGPARGIDTEALKYLVGKGVKPQAITVYIARFQATKLKKGIQWFLDLGGNLKIEGLTFGGRDAIMTRDSDYDILRYMPIEEQKEFFGHRYYPRVSGTQKNERRRKGEPLHVNHALEEWARKGGLVARTRRPEGAPSRKGKSGTKGSFKKSPGSM